VNFRRKTNGVEFGSNPDIPIWDTKKAEIGIPRRASAEK
jgi:hypothetical protein